MIKKLLAEKGIDPAITKYCINKGFIDEKNPSMSITVTKGNPTKMYIFGDMIELLSYLTLNKKDEKLNNSVFVSVGEKDILQVDREVREQHPEVKGAIICTPKGKEGEALYDRYLDKHICIVQVLRETPKLGINWNSELLSRKIGYETKPVVEPIKAMPVTLESIEEITAFFGKDLVEIVEEEIENEAKELFNFLDKKSSDRLKNLIGQYLVHSFSWENCFDQVITVYKLNGIDRMELAQDFFYSRFQGGILTTDFVETRKYTEDELMADIAEFIDLKIPKQYWKQLHGDTFYNGISGIKGLRFKYSNNYEEEKKQIEKTKHIIEKRTYGG